MKRRTVILAGCLATGLALAGALVLMRPGQAETGDYASVPEVASGTDVIPAAENVSSVFSTESIAPTISSSAEVKPGLSIGQAAQELNAPHEGVPTSWLSGAPSLGSVRALMTGVGSSSRTIYAYATKTGKLCAGLTGISGGCLPGFPKETPVDWTFVPSGPSEAAIVWGIAADSVEGVEVNIGNTAHVAQLRNNAYFFQAASPSVTSFDSLTVKLSDGSSRNVPLPDDSGGGIEALKDVTP